jgi:methylenetetrahydrofolate reductase (NADPH)
MQTFQSAVRSKNFVFSAELFLRPEITAEMIALQTRTLQQHVDGIMLADNQEGRLHLSPLAAASLVKAAGVDPIVQLSCRNRNRIALLAELLGAATLGVTSLVLLKGNRVPQGFNPRPRAVFDVDANELISMASKMTADECLPSLPDLYVGSIITPHLPAAGWVPEKLIQKADAGAQFAQTHLCMDAGLLTQYMRQLVAAGIPRRMGIFVKLAVCSSADDARWLRDSLPNNCVPDAVIQRLEQAEDAEREGVTIAAELIQQLSGIPGISGAHLVATQNLSTICAAIDQAGFGPSNSNPTKS